MSEDQNSRKRGIKVIGAAAVEAIRRECYYYYRDILLKHCHTTELENSFHEWL
jgi:hypothetical protein